MNKETTLNLLALVGLLVMLIMAVLPLVGVNTEWMRWGYAAATALVLGVRFVQSRDYRGDSLRVKRLWRIMVASAVLYCVSAALIFYHPGANDWIAFLMAGAVVQIYASFMIDRATNA